MTTTAERPTYAGGGALATMVTGLSAISHHASICEHTERAVEAAITAAHGLRCAETTAAVRDAWSAHRSARTMLRGAVRAQHGTTQLEALGRPTGATTPTHHA